MPGTCEKLGINHASVEVLIKNNSPSLIYLGKDLRYLAGTCSQTGQLLECSLQSWTVCPYSKPNHKALLMSHWSGENDRLPCKAGETL